MPRRFIRQRGGVQAPGFDLAQALRDALAVDGVAELWDHPPGGAPCLMFTLQRSGIAVLVVPPAGEVLGVFADPMRAVAHAFTLLDRATEHQRATHSQRARQRTTEKAQAR